MHGWGGEIASFKGLADALADHFRVVLIDLYGFGKTPHPDHPLTIGNYAEGVASLVESLGIEEAILVGHSFGGRIAMRIAAARTFVSGMVLIDSAGAKPRRGVRYHIKVAAYKLGRKLHIAALPKGSADYRALSGPMKRTFVNVVNENSEKDASRIAVPTLLIWGTADRDTPLFMCRRLHKRIKDSEVLYLEGAGHFSYLEHPFFVMRVIRAFRERV